MRNRGRLHAEPLLAVLLWGGIYPAAKFGLREIPALSFAALRVLLAALLLIVVARLTPRPSAAPHEWKRLLHAACAQTVFQVLLIAGIGRTSAANSAILLATAPLLMAVWLALAAHERLHGHQWTGLAVGLSGVALVVGGGATVGTTHLMGDLLAFGAAAAWVWYGLAVEPVVNRMGAIRTTAWTLAVAAAALAPFALAQSSTWAWRDVSWKAWAGLTYGAAGGLVTAMVLWGRAIHRFGPRETMVYAYLEPASAVALAALLLGEPFRPAQALGGLLTLASVWLTTQARPEPAPEAGGA